MKLNIRTSIPALLAQLPAEALGRHDVAMLQVIQTARAGLRAPADDAATATIFTTEVREALADAINEALAAIIKPHLPKPQKLRLPKPQKPVRERAAPVQRRPLAELQQEWAVKRAAKERIVQAQAYQNRVRGLRNALDYLAERIDRMVVNEMPSDEPSPHRVANVRPALDGVANALHTLLNTPRPAIALPLLDEMPARHDALVVVVDRWLAATRTPERRGMGPHKSAALTGWVNDCASLGRAVAEHIRELKI